MFMLKTLMNQLLSSQPQPNQQLIQIPSGQLWCQDKLLFQDCSMAITSTSTQYNYQLTVTRVSSDEDGIDDLDSEKEFLVDAELQFHFDSSLKPPRFLWTDPIDGSKYEYRIDARQVNKHTVDFFETTALECMFERKFNKPRDNATIADLDLLRHRRDSDQPVTTPQKKKQPPTDVQTPVQKNQATPTVSSIPAGEPLMAATGDLYLYDHASQQFVLQATQVKAELQMIGQFQYWLVINGPDRPYIGQPVESRMNAVFNDQFKSFIWLYHDDTSQLMYSWSLKFLDDEEERQFREVFSQCMYESLNKEKFSKVKEEDQNYLIDAYQEDVEMIDVEDEEDEEDEDRDKDGDESGTEEETDYSDTEPSSGKNLDGGDDKNSQLAVGYMHQRSFVVRGSRIGVFRHDHDNLEYATTINDVKTPNGNFFSPAKIMLHNQDSSMIMMNKDTPNKLFRMDLEVGKIVDEWDVDENRELNDFTHDNKYAQMTPQQTFVGISHNALFRIDPRLSGKKLVESQMNQYKSKNEFSCTSTTGKGDIIVASDKGDLRLYNQIDKRAKTHLPGLGDPIIGVDVTEDGKFILATCKTYLLVMSTEAQTDDGVRSGFQKSLGDKKPAPKRLQLRPEHVAWMNTPVSFTPARFNTGENMEKTIVTSSGPYVITWNFRRVKSGHLWDYTIKKYPQKVVADNFRYGSDKNLIVALPDDVTMANKKQLLTPTKLLSKQSLRDSIVNSPY